MRPLSALRRAGWALAGAGVIGVAAGALASQLYWGYAFARPRLPRAVVAAQKVVGVAELRGDLSGARCALVAEPISAAALSERIHGARPFVEELPGMRMTVALADRGLSPDSAPYEASVSGAAIHDQLVGGGLIAKGESGYDTQGCVGGFAVVVETSAGRRLLVEVKGSEVSNDHYPWSEAVFARAGDGWRLEEGKLLYYDVAGLEGAEWPRLHVLFAILALPFTSVTALVTLRRGGASSTSGG